MNEINKISFEVIGAAFKVHSKLGPGLLESAYKECLCYELKLLGIEFERECPIPLFYEDIRMAVGYRADLIVEETVLVEIKSVEAINDVHKAQVLTYLKLSRIKVGLLLNFNVLNMKNGITRLIL